MGAQTRIALPFPPAGMSWDVALAYTGVGEAQMSEWEREGVVRFRFRGPKGAKITTREQLDEALRRLFSAAGGGDRSDDFDFGPPLG